MMDVQYLLEKAKELLIRDKGLQPVLFVETEKNLNIVGIVGDFNGANKRYLFMEMGKRFARQTPDAKIVSLAMVSEANIGKMDRVKKKVEKCEAIVIFKLDVIENKKEIATQEFTRKIDEDGNDDDRVDIQFTEIHHELNNPAVYILDYFMEGYMLQMEEDNIGYN